MDTSQSGTTHFLAQYLSCSQRDHTFYTCSLRDCLLIPISTGTLTSHACTSLRTTHTVLWPTEQKQIQTRPMPVSVSNQEPACEVWVLTSRSRAFSWGTGPTNCTLLSSPSSAIILTSSSAFGPPPPACRGHTWSPVVATRGGLETRGEGGGG